MSSPFQGMRRHCRLVVTHRLLQLIAASFVSILKSQKPLTTITRSGKFRGSRRSWFGHGCRRKAPRQTHDHCRQADRGGRVAMVLQHRRKAEGGTASRSECGRAHRLQLAAHTALGLRPDSEENPKTGLLIWLDEEQPFLVFVAICLPGLQIGISRLAPIVRAPSSAS